MSVVKHVPVRTEDSDRAGMVKLCDCCRRPWILRKILSPFGPVQKFTGQTVLVWTPEKSLERWARRWWQFTLRFKGKSAAEKERARLTRKLLKAMERDHDAHAMVPTVIDPHLWSVTTETTETVVTEPREPEKFPYIPRFDETVVTKKEGSKE